ncbi:polar amino acid transport system substrate-binding protein [Clostridium saccharoperbutylacetonicum]|uniref:Amino acid ABC transporter substrate-binding protein, PAAT family n=1 Tax=Clostridium saccharoperbutylacetonicum N1-4(HMT) TaxID=931276 RepID=M1MSD5_9CLOT|nr:cysteine ABC transporter substrate-binding protein [Clostridium saccharoperbutylacetonicum]AGF57636.1 amino acid ABC transporter substrate-binding protein, PAAT family [Clostridium saccharoperbutylacetonicum N1-4(HMT)]NRT61596.1 polar amino acid transport system substrate-binding protein [Clostridium saccharoperbutylacetonicum]NSB24919.1 polar amino acid transport system substrate-binding protein [Clostridium saccharoperbutylacetonicum]NSB44290.1 polar amino acid transport system substrate-b
MKRIKKIMATLLLSTIVIGGLTGCGNSAATSANKGDSNSSTTSSSSIDEIKKRGTIKIGVFSDKAPFGYVDSNGKNQGFDVYIAKRFAKDLLGDESKVEFVLVDAASRVSYLESKKVDIIMANFTVTDERKQKVDFTNPYMKVSLGVVSPDGAKITSEDQLKGKKIIVAKGTTAETYMTKNHPDVDLVKYEQYSEIFQALKDKRGDAILSDNTEVIAWAKENPGFTVGIASLGSADTIAPAVTKGNTELRDWVNTELETLGKENFIHKAYDETLKSVYGAEFEDSLVVEGGKVQ